MKDSCSTRLVYNRASHRERRSEWFQHIFPHRTPPDRARREVVKHVLTRLGGEVTHVNGCYEALRIHDDLAEAMKPREEHKQTPVPGA